MELVAVGSAHLLKTRFSRILLFHPTFFHCATPRTAALLHPVFHASQRPKAKDNLTTHDPQTALQSYRSCLCKSSSDRKRWRPLLVTWIRGTKTAYRPASTYHAPFRLPLDCDRSKGKKNPQERRKEGQERIETARWRYPVIQGRRPTQL